MTYTFEKSYNINVYNSLYTINNYSNNLNNYYKQKYYNKYLKLISYS
jgi:hypothetical protein